MWAFFFASRRRGLIATRRCGSIGMGIHGSDRMRSDVHAAQRTFSVKGVLGQGRSVKGVQSRAFSLSWAFLLQGSRLGLLCAFKRGEGTILRVRDREIRNQHPRKPIVLV